MDMELRLTGGCITVHTENGDLLLTPETVAYRPKGHKTFGRPVHHAALHGMGEAINDCIVAALKRVEEGEEKEGE